MTALCLASGLLAARIATAGFTLAWMHSIEKVRWEEDWRLDGQALVLVEARIHGSGAGMEPPPEARLEDGVWRYPGRLRTARLDLAHSPYTAGYELCVEGDCRPLAALLPGLPESAVIELSPCPATHEKKRGPKSAPFDWPPASAVSADYPEPGVQGGRFPSASGAPG